MRDKKMAEHRTKKALEKKNLGTRQRVIILAARLILGGVFVFASIDKIFHPAAYLLFANRIPEPAFGQNDTRNEANPL